MPHDIGAARPAVPEPVTGDLADQAPKTARPAQRLPQARPADVQRLPIRHRNGLNRPQQQGRRIIRMHERSRRRRLPVARHISGHDVFAALARRRVHISLEMQLGHDHVKAHHLSRCQQQ